MTPLMAWTMGFLCQAVGLAPILQVAGYLPSEPTASRWAMISAGTVFMAGGLAVIATYGLRPGRSWRLPSAFRYVLLLAITGLMTALAAWVAFGSGPRPFILNVPFLPSRAGSILGRAAFVLSTILMAAIFLVFAIAGAIRLRADRLARKESPRPTRAW